MDGELQIEALRVEPRYGCAGDAEIVLPGRGLRYAGKIGDLSLRGCFIEVGCRLERGTAVEVWMNARGQPLRVAANLMVQNSSGVGLRFLGVPARKEEQIKSLIAELAEEAAAHKAAGSQGAEASGTEAGVPRGDGGMYLVEAPQPGMEEPLSEEEERTAVGIGGSNFWQQWRRRLGAWLSR